jgi:hypothetical protein
MIAQTGRALKTGVLLRKAANPFRKPAEDAPGRFD